MGSETPARVLVVAHKTAATPALLDAVLEQAAGGRVRGMVGVPSPLEAIQDAINLHGFDEIILSTLPRTVSRWLRIDLPHKVAGLGLPVTTVTAAGREAETPASA